MLDFTLVSLGFWAALINMVIFLSLIAIPWTVGRFRPLVLILGVGGAAALLAFDFTIGVEKQDYDLAADLMLLTLSKAVFFFLISYATEKIFRTFFRQSKEKNADKQWQEDEIKKTFDRNLRGLKNPEDRK